MELHIIFLWSIIFVTASSRIICDKNKAPLELGKWVYHLKHLDSGVVENSPKSINEGQTYVYENYFPGYIIKYIHVDNLAIKSCGASANIRGGGIGKSSVLIVLHAGIGQEIRSVVDIWGEKIPKQSKASTVSPEPSTKKKKSMNMFKGLRALNHNTYKI